ncbi:TM2 domain-containing protein [Lentilactobacillus otakiensis]|uniref:TM2 domain-containing protein n=1 Tax=Lentilactobacillus otakiensis TaxID=481720 RepID=UPI003D174E8F
MNNDYFVSQLTTEEMMLVNSEVEKRQKSPAVAYLLALFAGFVGGHRYYMGKTGSAVAMTLITVLTLGIGISITGIWALVDLFLINGWLQEDLKTIESEAAQTIFGRRKLKESAPEQVGDDQNGHDQIIEDVVNEDQKD